MTNRNELHTKINELSERMLVINKDLSMLKELSVLDIDLLRKNAIEMYEAINLLRLSKNDGPAVISTAIPVSQEVTEPPVVEEPEAIPAAEPVMENTVTAATTDLQENYEIVEEETVIPPVHTPIFVPDTNAGIEEIQVSIVKEEEILPELPVAEEQIVKEEEAVETESPEETEIVAETEAPATIIEAPVPAAEFPAKEETIQNIPVILAENTVIPENTLRVEKPSLLNNIAPTKTANDLASRVHASAITDLKREIGIAKKFEFINTLFKGNHEAYTRSIHQLNSFQNADEVGVYFQQLYNENRWNTEDTNFIELAELVKRRYL